MTFTSSQPERSEAEGLRASRTLADTIDSMGFTRSHKLILLLVVFGVFFDVIEQNAVGLVGPALQESWGIGAGQIGLLNSATFFAMTVGGIVSGALADRFGRRNVLAINLVVYACGALLCALAPNFGLLLVFRTIVGLGLGGELSTAITMLAEFSPTRFRAAAVSTLNVAGGGIGNFLAPLYGMLIFGSLAPLLGSSENTWRWLFGFLVLPVVLIVVFRRYLPETPRYLLAKGRIDECNRTLTILKNGRLVPRGRSIPVTRFIEKPGAIGLSPEKVRISEIFSARLRRRSIAVSTTYFMLTAGQISILTLMPTILVSQGFSIVAGVGYTAVMQAGSLLGALFAAVIGSRFKRRSVIAVSTIGAACSAIAFGLFATTTPTVLGLGALFQFFILMLNTTVWAWLPELFPTRIRGFGTGVVKSIGGLGAVIMTPVAGFIFDAWGLSAIFATVGALYLLALLASRFGPETAGLSLEELNEEADNPAGEPRTEDQQ